MTTIRRGEWLAPPDFDVMQHSPVTARQRRVIYLVADGCTNKEIASVMRISIAAVKKHLHALSRRYSVSSRAAIVRAAVEHGDIRLSLRQAVRKPRG